MMTINSPHFKISLIANIFFTAAAICMMLPVNLSIAQDETSPTASLMAEASATTESLVAEIPADAAAALYVAKCAGCHTIGGGNLTGPDLLPASLWPRADMEAAIKRMEKNVGPLSAQEVQELSDLLLSGGAKDRVAAEQQRAAMAMAAKMEPGSPARGKALFLGRSRLAKGGPPCMACHQVNGLGGSMGVDLTGVHSRMGQTALVSAIEGANFNMMRAAYANRPITTQEAIHLAAWLAEPEAPSSTAMTFPPAPVIGAAAAFMSAAFLVMMTMIYRRRGSGVRARLVRSASSQQA